jgi:cleavage stimulation factor subunit 3
MMELHWNKETKIAMNVFEHGLKTFGDDVNYVLRYLDFLIVTNDDASQSSFFLFISLLRLEGFSGY